MYSKLLFIFSFLFLHITTFAQTPQIARHSPTDGITIHPTTDIQSVINNSFPNDTIYLPGGFFPGILTIDWELHFIGTGHHPDSTLATSRTVIDGYIIFTPDAAGSSLAGVVINTDFVTVQCNDVLIERNVLKSVRLNSDVDEGIIIKENIIRELNGNYAENVIVSNNIFPFASSDATQNNLTKFKNIIFKNNLVFYTNYSTFTNIENSIFENNFFEASSTTLNYSGANNSDCLFLNNIFTGNASFINSTNSGANNIPSQTFNFTFVDVPDNISISAIYDYDFHLRSTSPGNDAGADGQDIGIYGGLFPWKEGSLPSNPHIAEKNIPLQLDDDGTLPVQIKVTAQEN